MFMDLVKKNWQNTATQGTVIITVGLMLSNVINYAFQAIMGRLLSPADYGTLNSLLSLSVIIGVPAGILSASLIKVSSELLARSDFRRLTYLFWRLVVYSLASGFAIFFIFLMIENSLAAYLNIPDKSLILIFGLLMAIALFRVIPFAYLQGLLRFKGFAFSVTMQSVLRFIIPIIFIVAGYGLRGVLGGLVISGLMAALLAVAVLKKNLTHLEKSDLSDFYRKIILFSIPVFFIQFGMQALNNIDVIMVKKFFEPDMAGYYAGVVTMGKMFLFGAGTIVTVMFPIISNTFAKNEDTKPVFKQFLSFQVILIAAGLFVFNFFPKLITLIFFGEGLLHSVAYLPRFSFFVALYILNNFMIMYFLAIEKTKIFMFFIPALIAQFVLLNIFHSSLVQVINVNIAISTVLLAALLFFMRKTSLKLTA